VSLLSVSDKALSQAARRFGTPLLVLDERCLRRTMRAMRQAFSTPRWRCRVFYAAKALALKAVARIAHEEGLGFDACSEGELRTALEAGVPPGACLLHGCAKTAAELELAVRAGIGYVIVDNELEIDALARAASAASAGSRRIPVLVRVNPAIPAPTQAHLQTGAPESKFGFPVTDGSARHAVRRIAAEAGLEFSGLHCHIGSQISNLDAYAAATAEVANLVRSLADEDGLHCRALNLGGGLAVHPDDALSPAPAVWAEVLFAALERHLAGYEPRPCVFVEPGRSVVARSGSTLYTVCVRKRLADGSQALIVDGGLSDNPRPALYDACYTVSLLESACEAPDGRYTVFGRHCETDLLFADVPLPNPRPGDILRVHDTGAYTYSMASNYNRFPRPAVVLVDGEEARLIARRETVERVLELDV
jgi:diaminopimelate decarboxylase